MKSLVLTTTAAVVLLAFTGCAPRDRGAEHARDVATACAGLTDAEVESAVGALTPSIQSVQSTYETISYPKGSPEQRLAGAIVYVRPESGETAEHLGHVLSCHALRHAPDRCAAKEECPLGVEGASVRTMSTSQGFAVAIESKNDANAREIVRRSRELTAAR